MYTVLLTSRRTMLDRFLAYVAASVLTTLAALFWLLAAVHVSPFVLMPNAVLLGFPVIAYDIDTSWLRYECLVLAALFFAFAVRVMVLVFRRTRYWLISETRVERRVGGRIDWWLASDVVRVRVVHFGHSTYVGLLLTNGRWLNLPRFADEAEARDIARHFDGHGHHY